MQPVGRPPSQPAPFGQDDHVLNDPLGFPLVFKQWLVQYVTQELQLHKVFGYQAPLTFVTGIVPPTGTTATAGTGFTYTHTDTSAIYVFTFSPGFSATPIVLAQSNGNTGDVNVVRSSISSSGFTVRTFNAAGTLADLAFNFLAVTVQ